MRGPTLGRADRFWTQMSRFPGVDGSISGFGESVKIVWTRGDRRVAEWIHRAIVRDDSTTRLKLADSLGVRLRARRCPASAFYGRGHRRIRHIRQCRRSSPRARWTCGMQWTGNVTSQGRRVIVKRIRCGIS